MALSNHQQTAVEFIQLLSVYPALIPNGSSDDGTNLKAALDEDLHEFATQMGVAASIHWHKPEDGQTDQVAIHRKDLADVIAGTKRLTQGLHALSEDLKAAKAGDCND